MFSCEDISQTETGEKKTAIPYFEAQTREVSKGTLRVGAARTPRLHHLAIEILFLVLFHTLFFEEAYSQPSHSRHHSCGQSAYCQGCVLQRQNFNTRIKFF